MKTRSHFKISPVLLVLFELGCSESQFQPQTPQHNRPHNQPYR